MAAFTTLATIAALTFAAGTTVKAATQKVPKPPAPTPPPELPKPYTPDIGKAQSMQRARSTGTSGRASTILTGASGASDPASTQRKTLIGY